MNKPPLKRNDLIYPELCYMIVGVLFDVWNTVGYGHREKYHQNAVVEGLKAAKLSFQREMPTPLLYQNKQIGKYILDFLIENKIVLELKVRDFFSQKDLKQTYAYLKANQLKL